MADHILGAPRHPFYTIENAYERTPQRINLVVFLLSKRNKSTRAARCYIKKAMVNFINSKAASNNEKLRLKLNKIKKPMQGYFTLALMN